MQLNCHPNQATTLIVRPIPFEPPFRAHSWSPRANNAVACSMRCTFAMFTGTRISHTLLTRERGENVWCHRLYVAKNLYTVHMMMTMIMFANDCTRAASVQDRRYRFAICIVCLRWRSCRWRRDDGIALWFNAPALSALMVGYRLLRMGGLWVKQTEKSLELYASYMVIQSKDVLYMVCMHHHVLVASCVSLSARTYAREKCAFLLSDTRARCDKWNTLHHKKQQRRQRGRCVV